MSAGYGIQISEPGSDITTASKNRVLMNTTNPFIKLDTQNATSFQSITLLITTDPPEPVGPATHAYTQLYKFKHGYSYVPSPEVLFYVSTKPAGAVYAQLYYQDIVFLSQQTAFDYAALYATTDATYMYLYVDKYNNGGMPNLLSGTNVQITTHIFLEDIGL